MVKKTLLAIGLSVALAGSLYGCNDSDDDEPAVSTPNADKFFNRIASFPVCSQVGSSCESNDATAVSYTHLDVYKRQDYAARNLPIILTPAAARRQHHL